MGDALTSALKPRVTVGAALKGCSPERNNSVNTTSGESSRVDWGCLCAELGDLCSTSLGTRDDGSLSASVEVSVENPTSSVDGSTVNSKWISNERKARVSFCFSGCYSQAPH